MSTTALFCIPGGHPADTAQSDSGELPHGWKLVSASVVDDVWYERSDGGPGAEILACPDHFPLPVFTPLARSSQPAGTTLATLDVTPVAAAEPLPDLIFRGVQPPDGGSGVIEVFDTLGQRQEHFQHWIKHSPTGYGWGYLGSGAADCARSLIAAAVGDKRAICEVCQGTNKIMYVPESDVEPRQADKHDPPEHVHACGYCEGGLRIYPSEYQRFKEAIVAGWLDTFVVTRAGIVGWLKTNFPGGEWPDIA